MQFQKWQNDPSSFPSQTIQHHSTPSPNTPNIDAKEAEVDWFYEDLQHLLELILKNNIIFYIKGWNAKVLSQKIPRIKKKKMALEYKMKQRKG